MGGWLGGWTRIRVSRWVGHYLVGRLGWTSRCRVCERDWSSIPCVSEYAVCVGLWLWVDGCGYGQEVSVPPYYGMLPVRHRSCVCLFPLHLRVCFA